MNFVFPRATQHPTSLLSREAGLEPPRFFLLRMLSFHYVLTELTVYLIPFHLFAVRNERRDGHEYLSERKTLSLPSNSVPASTTFQPPTPPPPTSRPSHDVTHTHTHTFCFSREKEHLTSHVKYSSLTARSFFGLIMRLMQVTALGES